jgi:hypothetical protein
MFNRPKRAGADKRDNVSAHNTVVYCSIDLVGTARFGHVRKRDAYRNRHFLRILAFTIGYAKMDGYAEVVYPQF